MKMINLGLQYIARTWWLFATVLGMTIASFGILFALEDQFEAITEVPVFDTQNDLTPTLILTQLPLYIGAAREAYQRFAAFDFVFPLVASLFLAVFWMFLLRTITWSIGSQLLKYHIPLIAFIATGFDYLENVSILLMLNEVGTPAAGLVQSVILFKQLKLTMLSISSVITIILFLIAILNLVYRKIHTRYRAEIVD